MGHRQTARRLDRTLGRAVQRHDRVTWRSDQQARRTDPTSGMVDVSGVAARTGVQEYEQPDGSVVRELRPVSEVMDPRSLATLVGQVYVIEHPGQGTDADDGLGQVTTGNARELFHGHVLSVAANDPEQGLVGVRIRLATDEVLAEIEAGKVENSAGYTTVLLEPTDPAAAQIVQDAGPEPGVTHDGERYDLIQTCIRYNHLALVSAARAGPVARLRMDSMKTTTIKVDGKSHKIPLWMVEAAKAAPKADAGETLSVEIEGMDPLVLPKAMVEQMLAGIGAAPAAAPTDPLPPAAEDPITEEDQDLPPEEEIMDADAPEEDEMKKDAIQAAVKAEVALQVKAAMKPMTAQVTDSVTRSSRDRAEVDRQAARVLGDRWDYAGHDEHGVAVAVLEAGKSPRLAQAKELAEQARKGDSRAAGRLRAHMDFALDLHRDSLDGSSDLLDRVLDIAKKDSDKDDDVKTEQKADALPWVKASRDLTHRATRRA